jgi:hypothetical protein
LFLRAVSIFFLINIIVFKSFVTVVFFSNYFYYYFSIYELKMSLSRLLPCSRVIFSGPILSSIRHLSSSTARSARFGGPGGTGSRFAEQFGLKGRTQTGPTLRERLLGPTTGKPFVYGTYALAGASVFGIGLLCYYGLGMSKGMSAMDRSAIWPEYVRSRLHHTYAYLAGSLALTAGAGMAAGTMTFILSTL